MATPASVLTTRLKCQFTGASGAYSGGTCTDDTGNGGLIGQSTSGFRPTLTTTPAGSAVWSWDGVDDLLRADYGSESVIDPLAALPAFATGNYREFHCAFKAWPGAGTAYILVADSDDIWLNPNGTLSIASSTGTYQQLNGTRDLRDGVWHRLIVVTTENTTPGSSTVTVTVDGATEVSGTCGFGTSVEWGAFGTSFGSGFSGYLGWFGFGYSTSSFSSDLAALDSALSDVIGQPAVEFRTIGAVAAGTNSASVPFPASIAAGDFLLLGAANKEGPIFPNTPTGFALEAENQGAAGVAGADSGSVTASAFSKTAAGTETGTLSFTATGAGSLLARMLRYAKKSGYTWDTSNSDGADNTAGTAFSVTFGSNPGITAGDVIVVIAATNADARTYSGQTLTATGATFSAPIERQDSATANGNDCALVITEFQCLSGTASAAPTFTMTASGTASNQNAGAAVIYRLRAANAGIAGVVASTLADATLSATATEKVQGAVASTLAAATTSAAGAVKVQGAEASALAGATLAATGTVGGTVSGAVAATLADAAVSATGAVKVQGAEASTLDAATVSGAGTVKVQGTDASTLADATVSAAAAAHVQGAVATTLAGATGAGAGAVKVQGAEASTLADAAVSATGTTAVHGAVASTLVDVSAAAAGAVAVKGSEASTLADATAAAAGAVAVKGAAAPTLADVTAAAAGRVPAAGSASPTLEDAAVVATGEVKVHGTEASTLEDATVTATGGATSAIVGTVAVALEGVAASTAGAVKVHGDAAPALADAVVTAAGAAKVQGSVAKTLDDAVADATAATRVGGTVTTTLADATVSAAGRVSVGGHLSAELDAATAAAAGRVKVSGELASVLGDAVVSAQGTVADVSDLLTADIALIGRVATKIAFSARPSTTLAVIGRQVTIIEITRGSAFMGLHVGDVYDILITITDNRTGLFADPSELSCFVFAPSGAKTKYDLGGSNPIRLQLGKFRLSVPCTESGRWRMVARSPGPIAPGREPYEFDVAKTVADGEE